VGTVLSSPKIEDIFSNTIQSENCLHINYNSQWLDIYLSSCLD
jgi:hypothetical protein